MGCLTCAMRRLLKLLRLPMQDHALLLMAFLLVCVIRGALWIARFEDVRRWSLRLGDSRRHRLELCPRKLATAIEVAARCVPAASCLTQALAAQVLLRRWGHDATLKLGVQSAPDGQFKAHAWVQCQGTTVIGDIPSLADFTPLPALAVQMQGPPRGPDY